MWARASSWITCRTCYRADARSIRLSARVADFAGSAKFLFTHAAWFAGWVALNRFSAHPLDPYPFLTFLVSLEAIFLSSFVLISQSHMERQVHPRASSNNTSTAGHNRHEAKKARGDVATFATGSHSDPGAGIRPIC